MVLAAASIAAASTATIVRDQAVRDLVQTPFGAGHLGVQGVLLEAQQELGALTHSIGQLPRVGQAVAAGVRLRPPLEESAGVGEAPGCQRLVHQLADHPGRRAPASSTGAARTITSRRSSCNWAR